MSRIIIAKFNIICISNLLTLSQTFQFFLNLSTQIVTSEATLKLQLCAGWDDTSSGSGDVAKVALLKAAIGTLDNLLIPFIPNR